MDLDKFLNFIAAIFGALGSIYVMLGVLAMSPDLIEKQASSYWDFSIPQIESLSQQKADNIAGFVFVILAFVVAGITVVLVPEKVRLFESKAVALAVALVLAGTIYLLLYFISEGFYRYQKHEVGKIITLRYVSSIVERGKMDKADILSVPTYARDLLGLDVSANEPIDALFRRTAEAVGVSIPSSFEYPINDLVH